MRKVDYEIGTLNYGDAVLLQCWDTNIRAGVMGVFLSVTKLVSEG